MEITRNGAPPGTALVTTSWVRDDYANGRRRYKTFAMQLTQELGPRGMQTVPVVIGEAQLEVPNIEVAKILHAALGQMLAKQPPELALVK